MNKYPVSCMINIRWRYSCDIVCKVVFVFALAIKSLDIIRITQQRRSLARGYPGYESGKVGYQDNLILEYERGQLDALTQLEIKYLPEYPRTFRCEVVALRIAGLETVHQTYAFAGQNDLPNTYNGSTP
jgi:hypothetical protein